jgi:hypothetical protein
MTFERLCPFCDGKIGDAVDTATGKPVGIVHTRPQCETYDRLDALDFVVACNRAAGVGPLGNPIKRGEA